MSEEREEVKYEDDIENITCVFIHLAFWLTGLTS